MIFISLLLFLAALTSETLTSSSSGTAIRGSLVIFLRNYPYLKNRDLSSNLFTFLVSIVKESYEFKNYKETIIDSNSDDKE